MGLFSCCTQPTHASIYTPCVGRIEQLWRVRRKTISPAERDEAHKTFQEAIKAYRRIAAEAPEGPADGFTPPIARSTSPL